MDYESLGLKAGLEIHQQLDTGRKLFCKCPAFLRTNAPDIIVHRKLHKVPGETGQVDVAVEYEASLDKDFIYQGYSDTTCLLEYDESPPNLIDSSALDETLKIALLLNCEIYPISQIMRKTVIDGSNTSGFQRTVLVAHDGFLDISSGKVGIASIALEEDAARIIERDKKQVIFRLDRLGIPLVEITTKAQFLAPEQIKECALKIGEVLRACKVKRGIGTIRQDLNISVKGHERVEIKGFQDPRIMVKTVEIEIERQLSEIKERKILGDVRNALPDGKTEFLRPIPGGARMYPETDLPLQRISREKINSIKKILPKLKTEIRDELKKEGLNDELINLVLSSNSLEEFETLLQVYNKDANLIGKMVTLWRTEFATKLKKSIEEIKEILTERILEHVLEKVSSGTLDSAHVKEVLQDILNGKSVEQAVKIEKAGHDELEEQIQTILKEKPGLSENAYMGLIIQKLGAKIDKRKAFEIIKRSIKS